MASQTTSKKSTTDDNKKECHVNGGERRDILVDPALTLGSFNLDFPPSLALSSTTSTSTTGTNFSFPLKTPKNQPIRTKISREERERMARDFMLKKQLGIGYDDLDDSGRLRANHLMSQDFSWSPSQNKEGHGETTFREQWDLFMDVLEKGKDIWGWKDLEQWKNFSGVFFEEEDLDKILVICQQKAGICYMHAVAVFQHYLWCVRNPQTEQNHNMLDLSSYIRNQFPTQKLEKFLKNGGGGSALEFFGEVIGADLVQMRRCSEVLCKKSLDAWLFEKQIKSIIEFFEKSKEPALVCEFKIEKDFKAPEIFVYSGEVNEQAFVDYGKENQKKNGQRVMHSMILLGYKKDDSGKVWFILQNFWAGKYLVVVSGEYLASCAATVIFAPSHVEVSLVKDIATIDAHYMETEVGPEEEEFCPPEEEFTP